MKKIWGSVAGFLAALLLVSQVEAAGIALVSGPYDPGNALGTINTLVNTMNGSYAVQGAGTLNSSVFVPAVTTPVNLIELTPAATGAVPLISVGGGSADANRALAINGNGTGGVLIGGASTTLAGLQVASPASVVNDVIVTPGATTVAPLIQAGGAGADTNVALFIAGTGTGQVNIGGTTTTLAGLQVLETATRVNDIIVTPAATGTAPSITVGGAGADANRALNIAGAGTGIVTLGQAICTVTGATPQTCNGQRGIVTTGTLTTAAATSASYVINNSSVAATSLITCEVNAYSGTISTNGNPITEECVPGAGTITVSVRNINAANALNGAVGIGFAVLN